MTSVNTLKSSSDILSSVSPASQDMAAKSSRLAAAQENVTNPNKFTSRAELDSSGLSRKYDEMQKTLLNVKSQDTTSCISHSKLSNEQKALDQVNKIMVRFESEMSQSNSAAGTTQDKVDRALTSLEAAFRSKDTSGKYVWGGKDANTDPLSKIDPNGNRISVSLVDESNIDNKLITNNYSSSAANNKIVTVSSEHDIRESFIHPSHGAMAKAVGYLNMVKENASAIDAGGQVAAIYTNEELAVAQREQIDLRGELKIQVDLEVKKVQDSFDVNKRDFKDAVKEKSDLFSADLIERTQKVKDLVTSFAASISISNTANKVSEKLFELRV